MFRIIALYAILIFAWTATEYKEPGKKPAPKIVRRQMPIEKPYTFPRDYSTTHNKLAGIFRDTTDTFNEGNVPLLALPPFTMATGEASGDLLTYITESAFVYLYDDRAVRVVRRDYDSGGKSRIKPKYILIGKVSTIGDQVRIIVRVQDLKTGEIIDSFDEYVDKKLVNKYL